MLNFIIECKSCKSQDIQTTLEADSGYSNWTVMDSGCVEFKCECGKFGSTDEYKNTGANQLDNFEVRCKLCGCDKWDYSIQDVDHEQKEPTYIECSKCHVKEN